MATIKVFDSKGVKELHCFDTLTEVPYLEEEIEDDIEEVPDKNPFE